MQGLVGAPGVLAVRERLAQGLGDLTLALR